MIAVRIAVLMVLYHPLTEEFFGRNHMIRFWRQVLRLS